MDKTDKQKLREAFSKRFKQAMEKAKITGSVRERAVLLGIPKSTLEGLENAEKLPARARSLMLAARLGVRETWLMTGEPPMSESVTAEPLPISHMSKDDQETLLAVWTSLQRRYGSPNEK